jgi:CxxC-x17-CxxC domain-containing protein
MELRDKNLTCRDCASTFVFTAGEQGFYIEKGLMNEPQRCANCRATRRRDRSGTVVREGATITCAECGQEAQVPFVPRLDRPVYCNDCFAASKERQPVAAS